MQKHVRTIITSALPYVNNVPHLGTMVCVVSADVYANFLKLRGEEVISVLGTDEHGTTAEVKAMEEGITPRQLVDKYFKIHKQVYEWFNCTFDCFGRTSSQENKEVTIDIFEKLDKSGFIKENTLQQTYCEKDQRFLSDRFVEGTCPYCDYPEARGDQCEKCGKLLNADELKNPKCKVCGSTPIIKDTKHLFINLPKIEPELQKWIASVEDRWSDNAMTMTKAWLKEGLKERCITRDLKWGIPVPRKGYEQKVFYSWFDAPIGYIGITKEVRKDWHEWWHSPDKTRLVQFMGKDNIPFHTILFPAFLIGTRDNYTLLNDLSVNEYLNYETGKFSKSRGEGVFGDDAQETGISADAFRYYLMVNRPETGDTIFTWDDFQSKINNELVANLGNLVNRTVVFLNKFYGGEIPEGTVDEVLFKKLEKEYASAGQLLEKIQLKEALKQIMSISRMGNQYFQEKAPWKTQDKDALVTLANLVKDLGILIQPYMPKTAESISRQLNIKNSSWKDLSVPTIKPGHALGEPELLFRKLEDAQVKEFKERFQGKNDRKSKEFPLNLKVAKILEAKPHPEAEKLVVLQIDLGDEKRQIVAGIKKYYSVEDLAGKKIVVVTNLQPAKLRGIESKGMLLAGSKGENLALVTADVMPGTQVCPEGIAPNKNQITIDDFAKVALVVKSRNVLADGKELKANNAIVTCDVPDGAKVQ